MLAPLLFTLALTGKAPDVLLRYKFHQGQTFKFQMDMGMKMVATGGPNAMPMNMDVRSAVVQHVTQVASDGTATIQASSNMSKSTLNGKENPLPKSAKGVTSTSRMTPLGEMSGVEMHGDKSIVKTLNMGSLQVSGTLPKGPVHVGTTWMSKFTLPSMGAVDVQNTVQKISKSGGSTMVYIKSSGSMDMAKLFKAMGGASGMKGTGGMDMAISSVFDASLGMMKVTEMSSTFHMKMMPAGAEKPMVSQGTQKMTMTLVSW